MLPFPNQSLGATIDEVVAFICHAIGYGMTSFQCGDMGEKSVEIQRLGKVGESFEAHNMIEISYSLAGDL
jgi:hypothetical protein